MKKLTLILILLIAVNSIVFGDWARTYFNSSTSVTEGRAENLIQTHDGNFVVVGKELHFKPDSETVIFKIYL